MNVRSFLKYGLIASGLVLLSACAKHHGSADLENGGLTAHGLGQMTHFAGDEPGESYTTQAPHNQLYLFDYDDSTVRSKYMPSINAQSEYLRSHPSARILLAGHTDERGSREYNIALGERRAKTIADILYGDGVMRNQVRVVSYGKERPATYGHDDESRKQNRRVELTYEATR